MHPLIIAYLLAPSMNVNPKVLVALVAIGLAVLGVYAGYFHDQSIKGVYNDLTPQIYKQNATITSLQNNLASANHQVSQLQSASVDGWFTFTGSECFYSCAVNGAVANYGTQDAKNIIATLTWKNNGAFVQTNTLTIGNLAGRSLQLFPVGSSTQYFTLNAPANQLSWSFTWTT